MAPVPYLHVSISDWMGALTGENAGEEALRNAQTLGRHVGTLRETLASNAKHTPFSRDVVFHSALRKLTVPSEKFQDFLHRHSSIEYLVPEDNEKMKARKRVRDRQSYEEGLRETLAC